ncbi:MAG: dependent protein [Bacteroidota bacterium]|nr:dependent protein [Bacteroidota bacterium]
MSDIVSNILLLKQQLPSYVKLVAVSKTKSVGEILEVYNTGQRIFGENRVQELLSKKELLPQDIEWHLIGHLQSNKVKYIVPFISMIHSVDSFKLLSAIDAEALKNGTKVNCLLQFHIAREETKSGFSPEEVTEMMESEEFRLLRSVRLCGVMGMATYTDDEGQVRNEFRFLTECFKKLKGKYFSADTGFAEISMGMSGDYKIAIEEGSTIIRIGSLIFGERL